MRRSQVRQNVCILMAAFIWGTAFVAQSICAKVISAFAFTAMRFVIASVVLFILVRLTAAIRKRQGVEERPRDWKALLWGGGLCGTLLAASTILQQSGLAGTSAGKASFITALYIVIVPLFGLLLHKKVTPLIWVGMVFAVLGLYFLCMTETLTISFSDTLVILCAVFFAAQILSVDHFNGRVNFLELSLAQMIMTTIWSLIGLFVFERPDFAVVMDGLRECFWPILYMGIFPSGLAYTLQIMGQRDSNPTVVALLMSLESVFGAVSSAIVLNDQLSGREYLGCALMMVAVVLTQLPPISFRKKDVQTPAE